MMNKYIDGFISGLPETETHTPLQIAQYFYKTIYQRKFSGMNKLAFLRCKNDNEKIIFDMLYPLLGAYKIQRDMDIYKSRFLDKLHPYISYELFKYIKVNINMSAGTIKDKHGNEVKILKFIRKEMVKDKRCVDSFETLEFVLYYNMINQANSDLYLVITNSIVSTIAMSSCGKSANWSSCQALTGDNHSRRVWGNLSDVQSLVCYITDFKETQIYANRKCDKQFKHFTMYQRNILRLLFDDDNKPYLILDRSYPNSRYSFQMANIVQQLAIANNMHFSIFDEYNGEQNRIIQNAHSIGLYNLLKKMPRLKIDVKTKCPLIKYHSRGGTYTIYLDQHHIIKNKGYNTHYDIKFGAYNHDEVMTCEEYLKLIEGKSVDNENR